MFQVELFREYPVLIPKITPNTKESSGYKKSDVGGYAYIGETSNNKII